MERAYKFRIYPTEEQEILINKTFGCRRFLYNYFLAQRDSAYKETGKSPSCNQQVKEIAVLKKELPWLCEVDSTALQQAARDLDQAFQNFFRRVKLGEKPGYPKYKKKHGGHQSYRSQNNHNTVAVLENAVRLPKLGLVKCKISKQVEGRIVNATMSRRPNGKYYVSVCCKDVEVEPLPATGKEVGIDGGVKTLATDDNGNRFVGFKPSREAQKRLASAWHKLSRKQKGSKRYEKQRRRVATLEERIANQRKDALHKLTTQLVRDNDLIAIEDLDVRAMLEAEGFKCNKQKKRVHKAVANTGLGEFRRQLVYKARWYRKACVVVEREFPSTQTCSCCGFVTHALTDVKIRQWDCPDCGAHHDRDINAAINILAEAKRLLSA